jgi:glycosyltransferase involved in cell wall biosynthesis
MLKKMDLGVFASSCENLPISLIEKMASGLPIACSNKKPMTEILERNSVYFNPENVGEIYKSILTLLSSNEIKKKFSKNGILLAKKYSWKKTSKQTFKFLEKFI